MILLRTVQGGEPGRFLRPPAASSCRPASGQHLRLFECGPGTRTQTGSCDLHRERGHGQVRIASSCGTASAKACESRMIASSSPWGGRDGQRPEGGSSEFAIFPALRMAGHDSDQHFSHIDPRGHYPAEGQASSVEHTKEFLCSNWPKSSTGRLSAVSREIPLRSDGVRALPLSHSRASR